MNEKISFTAKLYLAPGTNMTITLPAVSTLQLIDFIWFINTDDGELLQGISPDLNFNTSCNSHLYIFDCNDDCYT